MTGKRALAVVLLVVLAGCNGPLGPLSGGSDQPSLPPGVTEDGVNASALLDAHVESLENRSFTLEYELSATTAEADVVATVGPDRERAAVRIESPNRTEGYFLADDVQYEFHENRGDTTYYVVNQSGADSAPFVRRYVRPDELRILLAAGEWTTDGTTDCDAGTCWVLNATGVNESGQLTDADSFDGRAVVAPSGRVADISVTVERPDDTGDVTLTVSNVGETTVSRPEWVSEANRSGTRVGFE